MVDVKQQIRETVWRLLEQEGASRFPGARGRIPNFIGAEDAARQLAVTPEWAEAGVLKANPDSPQLPVRARALAEGKLLYVAVPRLRDVQPFLLLDPAKLGADARKAASIGGGARLGRPVDISSIRRIDLVVCGSVAVNRKGARLGKGGGFSDLEYGLLTQAGLVDDNTTVATTVHSLQVLEEDLPETRHDFRVDLIVTPQEVIRPGRRRRRRTPGIVWSDLDDDKISEIPVIEELAHRLRN